MAWITIEECGVDYQEEGEGKVRVSCDTNYHADDRSDSEVEAAITAALASRLGGNWSRVGEWSAASGETDITAPFARV